MESPDENDGGVAVALEEQQAQAPPEEKPTKWELERELLYKALANQNETIEELKRIARGPAPATVEQAVEQGILPSQILVPSRAPDPDTRRGEWFQASVGPEVTMLLCPCTACEPHNFLHYFCVVCKQGPFDYVQRPPAFTKNHMRPGNISGQRHDCCSPICGQQYQQIINRVARGHVGGVKVPYERPAMLPGSD